MKNVLITGGSGDIGSEIVKHLVKKNYRIFFTYNKNLNGAKKIKKKLNKKNQIFYFKVQNSNHKEIDQTYTKIKKKYGYISILINNAGKSQIKDFFKISKKDLDNILDINLKGTFYWCQKVTKDMVKNKFGRIINVASIGGQWGGEEQVHYAISKAGIICLTRSLAKIYSKYGITVNCISPGLIRTKMIKNKLKKIKIENIPSKRIGNTKDILSSIDLMIDERSSYITGQTINVNGGMYFS